MADDSGAKKCNAGRQTVVRVGEFDHRPGRCARGEPAAPYDAGDVLTQPTTPDSLAGLRYDSDRARRSYCGT